jgi:peptide/nickel transport system substrate-binding protein
MSLLRNVFMTIAVALALSLSVNAATFAQSKTFRWASSGELPSWDPHSQNNALSNGIHAYVYES